MKGTLSMQEIILAVQDTWYGKAGFFFLKFGVKLLAKLVVLLPKFFAAVVGALLALVLSGDIDKDGNVKITRGVVMRFSMAVFVSLYGGAYVIETNSMTKLSSVAQGSIFLLTAVFGLLIIGVLYQAVEMLKGKTLSQIAAEVYAAFTAIFKKGGE